MSGFGSIYSTQDIETLAPKQLSIEKEKLFSATENIIPKNIYIPHSIDQFIDRKKLYPKFVYRKINNYLALVFTNKLIVNLTNTFNYKA